MIVIGVYTLSLCGPINLDFHVKGLIYYDVMNALCYLYEDLFVGSISPIKLCLRPVECYPKSKPRDP